MSMRYYRLLAGVAASLSLFAAGCADRPAQNTAPGPGGQAAAAASDSEGPDTEATLWTVLGLVKRRPEQQQGPLTGNSVSPELWQAALDTMSFAGISAEDPMTGVMMTKWYSPPSNPQERLRVSVFVLSRALRSTSVSVTVERQARSPAGQWSDTPVAREVVEGIENAILHEAQQIHSKRYRNSM